MADGTGGRKRDAKRMRPSEKRKVRRAEAAAKAAPARKAAGVVLPEPDAQPAPAPESVKAAAPRRRAKAPPPEPAPAPAPAPAAESKAPAAAPPPLDPVAFLEPDQREALEKLSLNLAKAALTAQGAMTEAAFRQADRAGAMSSDPFKVGPALGEVMGKLAAQPDFVMKAQADLFEGYLDLWRQSSKRMSGEAAPPVVEPARGDKRFADPEWRDNPLFEVMKQSYLLTANWLNDLVGRVEGVDPLNKRRVEFFTKMLTDAFSPSNFLMSNPAALREAVRSQG